ncbi:MAG: type VI secretion system-associated protein TagO [Pseudomonadota bacterium]
MDKVKTLLLYVCFTILVLFGFITLLMGIIEVDLTAIFVSGIFLLPALFIWKKVKEIERTETKEQPPKKGPAVDKKPVPAWVSVAAVIAVLWFFGTLGSDDNTSQSAPQVYANSNFNPQSSSPPANRQPRPAPSPWQKHTDISPIDDSKNVTLSNEAESKVQYDGYRSYRPVLFVRCKENKTDVIVSVDKMIDPIRDSNFNEYAVAELRLDKKKAQKMRFSISTDGDSYFFRNPIPYIKKMMDSDTLVMRYQPYRDNNYTITFDLTGLGDEITELREACNW